MKTFSSTTRKNITASLIAPLAVIPASLLLSCYSLLASYSSLSKLFAETMFLIISGLIVAYPITVVVGFTSVLILKCFKYFNLVNTLLIAVLVASLIPSLFSYNLGVWLFIVYYALAIACLYWYVFQKVANKI